MAEADGTTQSVDDRLRHMFGRGLIYTAIYVGGSLAAFVITPVLTRVLGGDAYGLLATTLALAQVLAIVFGLGLNAGIQREYSDHGSRAAREALMWATGLAVSIGAIALATSRWWGEATGLGSFRASVDLGIWWAVASAVSLTTLSLFRAQDRALSFGIVGMGQAIIPPIAGLAIAEATSTSAHQYLLGLAAGQLICAVLGLLLARPRFPWRESVRRMRNLVGFSAPLVPHGLAFLVLNLGDRLVLQSKLGSFQVGRYQLAYTLGSVVIMLLSMLNQAWEPSLFSTKLDGDRRELLERSRDRLYMTLVPIVLATSLLAPIGLRILAPASYHLKGLIYVTTLVALSALPFAAYLGNLRILLVTRKTRALIWASPSAAVLNVLLNFALIPSMGIAGSAMATLLAYAALAFTTHLASRSQLRIASLPPVLLTCLAGGAAASLAFGALPSTTVMWLLARAMMGIASIAAAGALVRSFTRPSGPKTAKRAAERVSG